MSGIMCVATNVYIKKNNDLYSLSPVWITVAVQIIKGLSTVLGFIWWI